MRCVKDGKPYLIMEEQSGKAGQRFFAPQPHKGQLRLWTYQAIAHGAMGVNYFRWDTATFGAEEYWHGLLNHDRSKSIGFDEIQQTVKELKTLGREMLESSYSADLALVFDLDSDWALQIQPGNNKLTYQSHLISWYASIAGAHTGIDIIRADADLSRYKAVFAPLQYVLSEKQAAEIRSFVDGGGLFRDEFPVGREGWEQSDRANSVAWFAARRDGCDGERLCANIQREDRREIFFAAGGSRRGM